MNRKLLKEITPDELKQIQLRILDYVDAFCKKHNIMYSLACGTLLGAIRHKGFIPWDDDIDIQMLRPDYEKFIGLIRKDNNPLYTIKTFDDNLEISFAKVIATDTILVETYSRSTFGVYIDVFPIDGVRNEEDFKKRHKQVMQQYYKYGIIKADISSQEKIKSRIKLTILKFLYSQFTPKKIIKKINNIAQKEKVDKCDYLFEMAAGRTYRAPFSKKAFSSVLRVPFEDKYYPVLVGYDEYLKACYGENYMQIPPKEKQISHHDFKAYWKE